MNVSRRALLLILPLLVVATLGRADEAKTPAAKKLPRVLLIGTVCPDRGRVATNKPCASDLLPSVFDCLATSSRDCLVIHYHRVKEKRHELWL